MTEENSTTTQQTPDPIEQLIDEILDDMGLGDLPEEIKDEKKLELYPLIAQKLGIEMIKLLSDEDLKEYYEKFGDNFASGNIDSSTMQDINLFFSQKVENLPIKIAQILQDIKEGFVGRDRKE